MVDLDMAAIAWTRTMEAVVEVATTAVEVVTTAVEVVASSVVELQVALAVLRMFLDTKDVVQSKRVQPLILYLTKTILSIT